MVLQSYLPLLVYKARLIPIIRALKWISIRTINKKGHYKSKKPKRVRIESILMGQGLDVARKKWIIDYS